MAEQGDNRAEQGKPPRSGQFKPGQSGNPNGRPPERPIRDAIKNLLDANDAKLNKELAKVFVAKALKGDFRFAKEVSDRIDGKVTDRLDVTSRDASQPDLDAAEAEMIADRRERLAKENGE